MQTTKQNLETEVRRQRGIEIASLHKFEKKKGAWLVPSSKGNRHYRVSINGKSFFCTCADYETTGERCKHVFAVEYALANKRSVGRPKKKKFVESEEKRPTYHRDWTPYNGAQTQEGEIVPRLLRGLCDGIVQPKQKMGRPRMHTADVVFSATMKVYGTLSGRRTTCGWRSCADKGYLTSTPHYNTIFKYLEDPTITPILHKLIEESSLPLKDMEQNFAVDSTGVSTRSYSRWMDEKYGKKATQLIWNKVHLMCGVKTKIVTAVKITEAYVHDNTQFSTLVEKTSENFTMKEILADKAYLSKENVQFVASLGAVPYIPFKTNTLGTGPDLWQKLYHMFQYKRAEFLKHYHQRSNVESAIWMIKSKFGPEIRSKMAVSQENELLCKVLCHNLSVLVHAMFDSGINPSFLKVAA